VAVLSVGQLLCGIVGQPIPEAVTKGSLTRRVTNCLLFVCQWIAALYDSVLYLTCFRSGVGRRQGNGRAERDRTLTEPLAVFINASLSVQKPPYGVTPPDT
jgi:hypothetical protein